MRRASPILNSRRLASRRSAGSREKILAQIRLAGLTYAFPRNPPESVTTLACSPGSNDFIGLRLASTSLLKIQA
jgi:hypothetical protein